MTASIVILGEALMDCITQDDGSLLPLMGGSPFNLARAAALQGGRVGYLSPFSSDSFGQQLKALCLADGVQALSPDSRHPTSLAVVTLRHGQPSYGFYREGIADRDYQPAAVLERLRALPPGVLHTGSLMLVPPENEKIMAVIAGARQLGWTISIDVNLRPRVAQDLGAYCAAVMQAVELADWVKASDEDLHILGFADASFDSAVLHLILAVVPQPAHCFAEIARVMKPGGQVLVFDKFLRRRQVAPLRRLLNPLVRRVATRLDVVFEDLLSEAPGLALEHDQPALAGGWFRMIRLRKV